MNDNSNRISNFWQELKRRKVIRTITVYAAAAFVILELTDIVAPSLGLPDWTLNFIIVLISVGFIIAVILSWIYDIHPEGGVVKTEPAHKVKTEDIPKSSNSWRIASYISFVVIVGLIVLNVIPRSEKKEILDKSIAVLPLEYLSEDPDKEYLAKGILDAITGHLSLLEGLRVMPRTSVEKYREIKKTAKEIGEELGVGYLVEGSFLMVENQVKLTIQLVVAEEGDHIFFKEYNRDFSDIMDVTSEVAQLIAKEIEVAITPEEEHRIEKKPTISITAYDFVQRGLAELEKPNIKRAEELFNEALSYDSTYAEAYAWLAVIYSQAADHNEWFSEYFPDPDKDYSAKYLDTAMYLIDMAISYDDELAEAYVTKGNIFEISGRSDLALKEYERALQFNPNTVSAYWYLGNFYRQTDYVKMIDNFSKALSLTPSEYRGYNLPVLGWAYLRAGFRERSIECFNNAFKLIGDSAVYFSNLADVEYSYGNWEKSKEYSLKAITNDSIYSKLFILGWCYYVTGHYQESLELLKSSYEDALEKKKEQEYFRNRFHRLAHAYWENGFYKEADQYFDQQVAILVELIEQQDSQDFDQYAYYDLAGVYAFQGKRDKAYENLRIFNQRIKKLPLDMVTLIKSDPLFDNIRDEPEFQQIVRDLEAKYQAEHERVRQWLEENDLL